MPKSKPWSSDELHRLAAHYPAVSNRDLTRLLSTRTEKAIERQAGKMDFRKCHERLREMGAENVNRRWHPGDGEPVQ